MPWIHCPKCDEWHEVDEVRHAPPLEVIVKANTLSPVACAIVQNRDHLPPAFLRGKPVSLRVLGGVLGYSGERVRWGLRELATLGLIQMVEFGQAGRKRYAGTSRLSRARLAVA